VVVPPGGNVKVTATFSPPTGLDASQYPVYSGWITITSGSEALQIPYLGAAATLKDKEIFDTTEDLFNFPTPTLANSTTGGPVTGPSNYTLVGDDVPLVLFRTAFGSPVINLDLVAADINFTPTLSKRVSYSGVKTLGNLDSEVYLPRNNLVRGTALSKCCHPERLLVERRKPVLQYADQRHVRERHGNPEGLVQGSPPRAARERRREQGGRL
jgi:hypothetical protein